VRTSEGSAVGGALDRGGAEAEISYASVVSIPVVFVHSFNHSFQQTLGSYHVPEEVLGQWKQSQNLLSRIRQQSRNNGKK
jgi:hypothetical protein